MSPDGPGREGRFVHGLLVRELRRYAETRLGSGGWIVAIGAAGLPELRHPRDVEYADEHVLAVVAALARLTDRTLDEALEDFGRFVLPDLVLTYTRLARPDWDLFEFLEHVEHSIHPWIATQHSRMRLPRVTVTRTGPAEAVVEYQSSRQLCALARGMLLAAADDFGTPVSLSETACARRGAAACQFVVRARSAGRPTGRRVAAHHG